MIRLFFYFCIPASEIMIDVTAYIKELLFKHDCVILPDFGGFIGNYTPADINHSTSTFSPPVKAISFNRNLNNNDGLLLGWISERREIGYADARRVVEEFTEGLKARLSKGERVNFDHIGHFQNNKEGILQFEPDRESNYLLDSYGMSSFNRQPVENYDVGQSINRFRDREPVSHSNRRKMVWRAAIAVPFIAAMILVPLKTNLFKSNASLNPMANAQLEENKASLDKMAVEENTFDEASESLIEEPAIQAVKTEETNIPVKADDHYSLVAGSFREQSNAVRLMNEISDKGFLGELIKASNGFYRVIADSFVTKTEAIEARDQLSDDFPGIWILEK